jgi:HEPN domain-containing protein
MKHHTMRYHLSQFQWTHILQPVIQAIGPCKIYLMGVISQQQSISVFNNWHTNAATSSKEIFGNPEACFLLVLIEDNDARVIHGCRDKIEDLSDRILSIDAIPWVMTYSRFAYLLESEDHFAHIVHYNAILCCDTLPQLSAKARIPFFNANTANYRRKESLLFIRKLAGTYTKRAYSLMAGMELYISRKEYALAALLLHQSAEQLFTAIVYAQTGYRPQTHHLGRLYEYACFVCPSLACIWSLQSAEAYLQFRHLNKAYLEARYGSYQIPETALRNVAGRLYELRSLAAAATSVAA